MDYANLSTIQIMQLRKSPFFMLHPQQKPLTPWKTITKKEVDKKKNVEKKGLRKKLHSALGKSPDAASL